MSGAALAEYARRKHPRMNIILMSGTQVELAPAITTFLQKPLRARTAAAGRSPLSRSL
jgi:hypothetical protein